MDLKVLMATREYGNYIVGGAGIATTLLTKYLRLKNIDVHVLSFGKPYNSNEKDYYIYPKSSVLEESRKPTSISRDCLLLYDILRFTKKAKDLIKSMKFDIVHVQERYIGGLITFRNKVTTFHSTGYGEINSLRKGESYNVQQIKRILFSISLGYFMEYASLSNSRLLITPSNVVKNELIYAYKIPADKIYVIHNGIELPKYSIKKEDARKKLGLPYDKIIIFNASRHIQQKRLDILIHGFYMLCRERPDLCKHVLLIIGGQGNLTEYLKSLCKRYNLTNVVFVGWIPHHKIYYYLSAADIYTLTSNYESAPLAILEACAHELPIITTRVGDYALMMKDHEDALIIPPNDAVALKNALIELITDEKLRRKIALNARKFAEKFSWEQVAEKHIKVYKRLLEE
ncbi:MAG: glycosyltransferase family 4 protein [Candidatus Bathyarchaeia archaeon]